jgi:hypothetical protein
MDARRFVLLHSPLLGPFSLQPLAAALAAAGARAETAAWPRLSGVEGGYYAALAGGMAERVAAGDGPPVLVAHGAAGELVPALVAALVAAIGAPPAGVVFLDAVLPHPGRSWLDAAPPETQSSLRAGAQMGQLPPWDGWWPPGALERLVPDAALRQGLIAELEPLPLAYFEEAAPPADLGGLGAPAAYLQLSASYADELRAAGRLGWPAVSLPLTHLAPLTQPKAVAQALQSLAARLSERVHG